MKKQQTKSPVEMTREERRRRRRRRLFIRRSVIVLTALLLLAALVWGVIEIIRASSGKSTAFLGVKSIIVEHVDGEGTVRYADEDIIAASGLHVNQSLLSLNKVQASERVLAQFPYLDFVEVKNTSFSTVCIRVAETKVIAAVQSDDAWLIVGANNHVLEQVTTDALPAGVIRVVGAVPLNSTPGADALDSRDMNIVTTLTQAIEENRLSSMTTIDLAEKTDLRVWWNDRVEILLGNETNMPLQMTRFSELLPNLIGKNGENIYGQLNMVFFADDNPDNDRAVFTPKEPDTSSDTLPGGQTTQTSTPAA